MTPTESVAALRIQADTRTAPGFYWVMDDYLIRPTIMQWDGRRWFDFGVEGEWMISTPYLVSGRLEEP